MLFLEVDRRSSQDRRGLELGPRKPGLELNRRKVIAPRRLQGRILLPEDCRRHQQVQHLLEGGRREGSFLRGRRVVFQDRQPVELQVLGSGCPHPGRGHGLDPVDGFRSLPESAGRLHPGLTDRTPPKAVLLPVDVLHQESLGPVEQTRGNPLLLDVLHDGQGFDFHSIDPAGGSRQGDPEEARAGIGLHAGLRPNGRSRLDQPLVEQGTFPLTEKVRQEQQGLVIGVGETRNTVAQQHVSLLQLARYVVVGQARHGGTPGLAFRLRRPPPDPLRPRRTAAIDADHVFQHLVPQHGAGNGQNQPGRVILVPVQPDQCLLEFLCSRRRPHFGQ